MSYSQLLKYLTLIRRFSSPGYLFKNVGNSYRKKHRLKRGFIFLDTLEPSSQDTILDLGSGSGDYFFQLVKPRKNVFISDISSSLLSIGKDKYGYQIIQLDANKRLNFGKNTFDVIFCNSLIEHVTGDKKRILNMNREEFAKYAFHFQKRFAQEIRRIGKSYFVQTPYRYFPIESHTWLPTLFIFLPRKMQIRIIMLLNRYWPKKTYPDWNLLTIQQMKELFPDAEIMLEKSFGFVKSIIAIKRKHSPAGIN